MMTAYDVLGVAPDASSEDIRLAYRARIRLAHPDRAPEHERDAATRLASDINAAYEILSDPVRRAEYDRSLQRTADPSQPSSGAGTAAPSPARTAAPSAPSEPATLGDMVAALLTEQVSAVCPPGAEQAGSLLLERAYAAADDCGHLLAWCLTHDEAARILAIEGLGRTAADLTERLKADRSARATLEAVAQMAASAQMSLAQGVRPGLLSHATAWRYRGHGWPASAGAYYAGRLSSQLRRR